MNTPLQTLLALIAGKEFDEDDSWINITAARWSGRDIAIDLSVRLSDEQLQHWSLECDDIRESRIVNSGASALEVLDDHPLLWPHNQLREVLYFRGKPADASATEGRLLEAHWSTVDRWLEFDRFLRPQVIQLLAAGHGKIAEGPLPLIQAYAD